MSSRAMPDETRRSIAEEAVGKESLVRLAISGIERMGLALSAS